MQNEVRDLEEDMSWIKDRVLSSELACNQNLKFRGFPDSADKNLKALGIIGPWLTEELKLGLVDELSIERAFCVGPIWERNLPLLGIFL